MWHVHHTHHWPVFAACIDYRSAACSRTKPAPRVFIYLTEFSPRHRLPRHTCTLGRCLTCLLFGRTEPSCPEKGLPAQQPVNP